MTTPAAAAASEARWEALAQSAAAVRAPDAAVPDEPHPWRRAAITASYIVVLAGFSIAALHAVGTAATARADGSADADLFSLTNQDRSSNGVRAMSDNGTLSVIGEGGRYNGCGFAVNGRSVDMIQRNYFAHPILDCGGQYVFSIMQAYGIHYMSAGENIGWNTYGDAASAASAINSAFMASPDHRANILDGSYTALGVGSDNSGASAWSGGGGGSYTGVWMFSEEFAQLAGSPPPPPPPPPPRPRPTHSAAPPRNSPAAATPLPPASAATPAASTPPPAALPTPLPIPVSLSTLTLPPPLEQPGGLLFNSVESVLESYLID